MDPVFLIVAVVAIFLAIPLRERYKVSTRQASSYRVTRRRISKELMTSSRNVPAVTWDIQAYRWRERRDGDRVYYLARMVSTQRAVYLQYKLVLWPLFGVPLVLPSYRIPADDIVAIRLLDDSRPSSFSRRFGYKPMQRIAIETRSNSTCVVEFSQSSDIHLVHRALSGALKDRGC
jgi:hypothetical protein